MTENRNEAVERLLADLHGMVSEDGRLRFKAKLDAVSEIGAHELGVVQRTIAFLSALPPSDAVGGEDSDRRELEAILASWRRSLLNPSSWLDRLRSLLASPSPHPAGAGEVERCQVPGCNSPTERGICDDCDKWVGEQVAELEGKPRVERNEPGHKDSGGRIIVPFSDDEQMRRILAALSAPSPSVGDRRLPDYTGEAK